MDFLANFRASFTKTILGLTVVICLVSGAAFALDANDSQTFIAGFNAYQKKDYSTAIEDMNTVLKKYPDSPLRDMALFWLARASYKSGDLQTAAKTMSQFFREYPDSPLKATVEDDLLKLVAKYDKGEPIPGIPATAVATAPAQPAPSVAAAEAALKAAAAKAEAERIATEKAATAKAESDRLAAEQSAKAAAEKLAAEKTEADRIAAEQALKVAAAKAEAERIATEKAASAKAEADRAAAERAASNEEVEWIASQKAAAKAERMAAEKAAADKLAAEKAARMQAAEAERLAAANSGQPVASPAEPSSFGRLMAEKAAAMKEIEAQERIDRQAAAKEAVAKTEPPVPAPVVVPAPAPAPVVMAKPAAPATVPEPVVAVTRPAEHPTSATAAAYREKAITEYKSIIRRFPGTHAAADAEQKLKGLGIELPAAGQPATPASAKAQILNLEVGQFADIDFTVLPVGDTLEAGKRYTIPFEAINRGNGDDRFELVSGFPAEFNVQFAAAQTPDTAINLTPTIAPGEKFKGVIILTIPRSNIDGQRNIYPVKLVSQVSGDASQSREVSLVSSAPLMRAVIKSDKGMVPPGGTVTYRISLLNIGTSAARDVTLRLNYPPQFEPVDITGTPFTRESETALALTRLKVNSGESREYTVVFRVKDEAIARQELFCRADVMNGDLDTSDSFLSTVAYVETVSGVAARTTFNKLVVIPGQTVTVPIIVTNTGNAMDSFTIKPIISGELSYSFYHDLNRDGMRQSNEPAITRIGPLAPKEEAYLLLEIASPFSATDGSTASVNVAFEPDSDQQKQASVATRLAFSRPLIEMTLSGKSGRIKPGEVVSVDLNAVNHGSNMAKVVEIQTTIPSNLDVVASDPPYNRGNGGEYVWKFEELGAGEKRNIRLSFRVKPGVAMGTAIQVKNVLNYRDQLGNRY